MSTRRRLVLLACVTVAAVTAATGFRVASAASLGLGSTHLWAGAQTLTRGTCTVTGTVTGSGSSAVVHFPLSSCGLPSTGGADSATVTLTLSWSRYTFPQTANPTAAVDAAIRSGSADYGWPATGLATFFTIASATLEVDYER